jgi:hypothetical protein
MTPETDDLIPPWHILACVVGLPLCTTAWILARRDLQAMASGRMDSSGAETTEKAKTTAALGIFVAFLWFVPLLTCVGLAVIASVASPRDE